MIPYRYRRKKVLTTREVIKLAKQLSMCPDVTRFNEGRWREEWALAYCFSGVEDSAHNFLNQHLPKIIRSNIGDKELLEVLMIEICEEFRHVLYHIREPRFYRYLSKKSEASLSQARPGQTRTEEETKVHLLKEANSRAALVLRLTQLPKVTQYDTDDWKEADAVVRALAGVEGSFRRLLDEYLPRLTRLTSQPQQTLDLLFQIGQEFLRILNYVKGSRFYWYLLEPFDQEFAQKSFGSDLPV